MENKIISKWLTIQEASEYLRCSERYLREMVTNRKIPHTVFAGKMLFHQDRLDDLLFGQEVPVELGDKVDGESDPTVSKESFEIRSDCNHERVEALIKELIEYDEHFVTGLALNLKRDLEKFQYQSLSHKVYSQLSRWCWPKRNSSREKWIKPRSHELSKLLFGKVIKRTNHPSYRS